MNKIRIGVRAITIGVMCVAIGSSLFTDIRSHIQVNMAVIFFIGILLIGEYDVFRSVTKLKNQLNKFTHQLTERENKLEEKSDQLFKLKTQCIDTLEIQQQRLSQVIHNDLGQYLTGIKYELEWIKNECESQVQSEIIEKIKNSIQITDHCMRQMKQSTAHMHPPMIDQLGLKQTLENHVRSIKNQYKLKVTFNYILNEDAHEKNKLITIYRAVQEALTNIVKHAHASVVSISCIEENDAIIVTIHDDGIGVQSPLVPSVGLTAIESQVACFEGEFTIMNNVSGGAVMRLSLPRG